MSSPNNAYVLQDVKHLQIRNSSDLQCLRNEIRKYYNTHKDAACFALHTATYHQFENFCRRVCADDTQTHTMHVALHENLRLSYRNQQVLMQKMQFMLPVHDVVGSKRMLEEDTDDECLHLGP